MLWENLREEEFDLAIERSGGVCVIPIGCLEKHGRHLPVGTDYFQAMHIVKRAADAEPVVIFPIGAWLGDVSCFHAFKDPGASRLRGCIGISQKTLLAVLGELCDEIARNGFKKILLVNGHGGNDPLLKLFLRMQSYESKDYATLTTSAYAFSETAPKKLLGIINSRKKDFKYLTEDDISTLERFAKSGTGGGHADIRETSMMMDINPLLVAPDRFESECGESTHLLDGLLSLSVDCTNSWLASYPASYAALAPLGASATIGRAMMDISVERLSRIFKAVKEDTAALDAAKLGSSKD